MRQLLVASLALTSACAARTTLRPAPVAATTRAPQQQVAEASAAIVTDVPDRDDSDSDPDSDTDEPSDAMVVEDTTPAYALVFHEGQTWHFDVESSVAMSGVQHANQADCRVAHVEYFCDRMISHVECSSEPINQIVGGIYTKTGRGLWRQAWNGASEQLDDKTRMFARFPESLVDGTGEPTAVAFDGGWCVSSAAGAATTTMCIRADRGIVGGSIATANGTIRVGAVPRDPARVALR